MSESKSDITLTTGDRIGAYRIERSIGSGGMAEVYYAIHEGLERPAAIKVLKASLAADDVHLQRFMQEARAAASLVHPNIVQVYDVGNDGEHRYIAQEYIAGSNLRQYLALPSEDSGDEEDKDGEQEGSVAKSVPATQDRQLPLPQVLSILVQVLAALHKSASCGIVHRDIKPENIMLTRDGDVKVADFGLARVLLGDDPQLTRAGTTLGTPMYMSPEQIQEGTVDIRSDLYSLGVTVYHMLCGKPPFMGDTPLALAMKHVQATVPDVHTLRADIPDSLVEFLSNLLSKSPEARFENPTAAMSFLKSRRSTDLGSIWPEQTVPLPGASVSTSSGPLEATILLQAKLRQGGKPKRGRLVSWLGTAALLLCMFAAGAAYTFELPHELFRIPPPQVYHGIPKASSITEQYKLALLHSDWVDTHKWEAVREYWPARPDMKNGARSYFGLASIKLAEVELERGGDNFAEAEALLNEVINDPKMESLNVAIAHLYMAKSKQLQDDEEKLGLHVEKANEIANTKVDTGDREKLDEIVDLMPSEISNEWFSSSN